MEVMLDTNAYSDLMRTGLWGKEVASAKKVQISTIVIGELYHGFFGGNRRDANINLLDDFLKQPSVELVPVCQQTAKIFGELIHPLKKKGITIPTNDVWVAAAAFVNQTTLLTTDKDFRHFPQVRTISPSR